MFRKCKPSLFLPIALAGCFASKGEPIGPGAPGDPSDSGARPDGSAPVDRDGGPTGSDGGVPPAPGESAKANVRFKRNERLKNDIAQALSLPLNQVCLELGQYDCASFVHRIALGGVEPYELAILEPFASTTVTTPIAVERLAFYACERRVSDDLAGPGSAVIFRNLSVDASGKLADVESPPVREALDTLYRRAVQRPIEESEAAHLAELYREIEAGGGGSEARDWAILSCFSALTTMEALFY